MSKHYISCNANYEEATIILVGAPFDGTASNKPGSRFAPDRIRLESQFIETYSPYQNREIDDLQIHDFGDMDVYLGQTEKTLQTFYDQTKTFLNDGKKVLTIGGEHLISFPVIDAHLDLYPDLRVIHFDAHTDLRDIFWGEALSHATVLKKVADRLGDHRLFQFGIRSGTKEEFEYAKTHQYIEIAGASTIKQVAQDIKDYPVYITLDVDVLDPSLMMGTGTPEAGGLTYKELLEALLSLRGLNIVGIDIVELAPDYDHSGVSTATATTLIRELFLLLSQ